MTAHVLLLLSFFEAVFGLSTQVTVSDLGDVIGTIDYTEWSNRSILSFRGIPYAEPPIGDLRFRPPVRVTSWNGTLNATSDGPHCPQAGRSYMEDCLTLNVFVPEREDSGNETLLPILIHIHGGTFRTGTKTTIHPYRLADEEDLILVVPHYRLGLLGLFSLLNDDVPGNVQFLDQIMAMQWVQDNIEYFGGDKNRVTISGQSSGSASVQFHLLSPLTKGLFHRTILQSGSALRTFGVDDHPIESALILANYCGCRNMTDSGEIASCMRDLTTDEILDCSSSYLNETIDQGLTRARAHMAVVQTTGSPKFLTAKPADLVANGEFWKLPMMGGVTRNDGNGHFMEIYNNIILSRGLENDTDYARYNATKDYIKYLGVTDITNGVMHTMMKTYFTNDNLESLSTMIPGLLDICSLISYKAGKYETLRANRAFANTYLYTFEYKVDRPDEPIDLGIRHGDDLFLIFPREEPKEKDLDMAKILVKLWTSFIINGVPTAEGVTWPAMSTPVGPYLVIDAITSLRHNFLDEFVTVNEAGSIIRSWNYLIIIGCFLAGRKLL